MKVYIGWDSRETIAYDVAAYSLKRRASVPVDVRPIKRDDLIARSLYTREVDPLATTEFTYSRFFAPFLADYQGWVLFVDCDFLFLDDIAKLIAFDEPSKAVYCVKHDYRPKESVKMDGKPQTSYPRKNWSSFMWFNCSHESTRRLQPDVINRESGAYLHRMQWADDSEIGEIPYVWNFLEGFHPALTEGHPSAVHYTRGGPWFDNWQDVDYGDEWRAERDHMLAARSA